MSGLIWMFSDILDDEDIEFAQKEYITIREAMEYYHIGEKALLNGMRKCGSVYKVGKKVLIRRKIFEQYLREKNRVKEEN